MNAAVELSEVPLFRGLGPDQIASFAGIAQEIHFEPEQTVYGPSTAGDSMYVIVQGDFSVRVTDENGEEVEVATLECKSYFGEMEVIGGMSRTASVVSVGEGRCYRFDARALLNLLDHNAPLAAHFYRQVSRELIKRLRNTTRDMGYFKARVLG